ncbi:unnamed protein product [Vitrella brassicaformis CCMP3155]|uniref:PHD-type domain-containing protein n=1 Tax=Vitrella brassicaformis (strain CCMP3155) TaxID=1169540 RepID=A0A0G4ESJ6_VITBC|nr:unnamed protein product [Vitrella brassicaformis CCMP3155]|eukprot:CEM00656.1 unnamed protein product [Vitrella brassicaformis CCMP3155]
MVQSHLKPSSWVSPQWKASSGVRRSSRTTQHSDAAPAGIIPLDAFRTSCEGNEAASLALSRLNKANNTEAGTVPAAFMYEKPMDERDWRGRLLGDSPSPAMKHEPATVKTAAIEDGTAAVLSPEAHRKTEILPSHAPPAKELFRWTREMADHAKAMRELQTPKVAQTTSPQRKDQPELPLQLPNSMAPPSPGGLLMRRGGAEFRNLRVDTKGTSPRVNNSSTGGGGPPGGIFVVNGMRRRRVVPATPLLSEKAMQVRKRVRGGDMHDNPDAHMYLNGHGQHRHGHRGSESPERVKHPGGRDAHVKRFKHGVPVDGSGNNGGNGKGKNPAGGKGRRYCLCEGKSRGFMICCDKCQNWFHPKCVGLTTSEARNWPKDEAYYCPPCRDATEDLINEEDVNDNSLPSSAKDAVMRDEDNADDINSNINPNPNNDRQMPIQDVFVPSRESAPFPLPAPLPYQQLLSGGGGGGRAPVMPPADIPPPMTGDEEAHIPRLGKTAGRIRDKDGRFMAKTGITVPIPASQAPPRQLGLPRLTGGPSS